MNSITIDEAIAALIYARQRSPLGGETVLTLCEEEREYTDFQDIGIEANKDGAVCLLSLHNLPDTLQIDGKKTSCHLVDWIDRLSEQEALDRCIHFGNVSPGGWPDEKCRRFLKDKRNQGCEIIKGDPLNYTNYCH